MDKLKGKALRLLPLIASLGLLTGCADDKLGEKMAQAGLNTLMGMGIVFLVLILISFIISCFKYINKAEQKLSKKQESTKEIAPQVVEEVPAEEEVSDDTELVAVIAAAIAAYEGTDADGVIVRSIRKVSSAKTWKRG